MRMRSHELPVVAAPHRRRGKRFGLPEQVKADGADARVQHVLQKDVHAWMAFVQV